MKINFKARLRGLKQVAFGVRKTKNQVLGHLRVLRSICHVRVLV